MTSTLHITSGTLQQTLLAGSDDLQQRQQDLQISLARVDSQQIDTQKQINETSGLFKDMNNLYIKMKLISETTQLQTMECSRQLQEAHDTQANLVALTGVLQGQQNAIKTEAEDVRSDIKEITDRMVEIRILNDEQNRRFGQLLAMQEKLGAQQREFVEWHEDVISEASARRDAANIDFEQQRSEHELRQLTISRQQQAILKQLQELQIIRDDLREEQAQLLHKVQAERDVFREEQTQVLRELQVERDVLREKQAQVLREQVELRDLIRQLREDNSLTLHHQERLQATLEEAESMTEKLTNITLNRTVGTNLITEQGSLMFIAEGYVLKKGSIVTTAYKRRYLGLLHDCTLIIANTEQEIRVTSQIKDRIMLTEATRCVRGEAPLMIDILLGQRTLLRFKTESEIDFRYWLSIDFTYILTSNSLLTHN